MNCMDARNEVNADRVKSAAIAANFAERFHFSRHRGVIESPDHKIVFGNDGYASDDGRSKAEAEAVLDMLRTHTGVDPDRVSLGVSDDGYSWAIVVEDFGQMIDPDDLEKWVWEVWTRACGI